MSKRKEGKKMFYVPPITKTIETAISSSNLQALVIEFLRRGTFIHDDEEVISCHISQERNGLHKLTYTTKKDIKEVLIEHGKKE